MSEENNSNKTPSMVQQRNDILNSFKEEFASSVIPVLINSRNKEYNFREVTVKEQKALSKTMIQNENRKDIVYNSQCALINQLCLDKDFDIYELTEFDRIKILLEIYSSNYIQTENEFKCPECGTVNTYKIDFSKVIHNLDKFDLTDKTYNLEDNLRNYTFTLNYPSVYNVSQFYKDYVKQYKNVNQNERELLDNLGNIEYINLFVKKLEIVNKKTGKRQEADLTLLTYTDIESLFSIFPQNILFNENSGLTQHITKEYIEKIHNAFDYEKCGQCGSTSREGIGDLVDFF